MAKASQTEGKLLSVTGVKIVHQFNPYSTSRLPYYVRFVPPDAQAEKVELQGRWADIPEYHPFLDIDKMTKVESHQQHCVLGARWETHLKLNLPIDIEAFA